MSGQPGKQALGRQIGGQDQQGQHEHLIEAVDILQLLDHGGEHHGAGPGDEDQGADGDHGVDEIVAEDFNETGQGVGRHHPQDGLEPAVPHEHSSGLPPGVHFGQGVLHHQIGRREVVYDVAQDHQQQGVLQAGAGKEEQIGHTQHHPGNGVGHQGNALDGPLISPAQGAAGGDERRAVGDQGTQGSGEQRHEQGMAVSPQQAAVGKDGPEVLQGKAGLIGPLLHQRHHHDHGKNGQDPNRDGGVGRAPPHVPQGVLPQLRVRDPAIPDIEPLQQLEDADAADGRDEHHHGDHRAPVEIRDAAQHLIVEQRGDDFISAAYRGRDAEVGKAQKKGLNKGSGKGPQKRTQHCDPEGGQDPVAHHLGDREGLFVHKPHGVVDQKEGHGNGVDHISHHQAEKSIDIKQLPSQQPRQQALLAEGVDDGKAVSNGGQKHGQGGHRGDESLAPPGQTCVMHPVGQQKRQHGGCRRRRPGNGKAVAECRKESLPGQHRGVEYARQSPIPEGLPQQEQDRAGQEHSEQGNDDRKDQLQLTIGPCHRFPLSRLDGQHGAVAEQGIDVVALDLQLIEDKFPHKIIFGLMDDLLRPGILGNGALLNDQHPVGEGQSLLRVVSDDDGGQVILPGNGLDPVFDGLLDDAVQSRQRLIQQQDPGLHHHGPGQGDPLLLAAGELVDALAQMLPQAQQVDELLHLRFRGDIRPVPQAVGDVLADVQVGEQGVVLKDDVEAPLLHGRAGQILPVVKDTAAVCVHDAQDQVQQRGLSAAGGPQNGDDLSISHLKRNILQDRHTVKGLLDMVQFQHKNAPLLR